MHILADEVCTFYLPNRAQAPRTNNPYTHPVSHDLLQESCPTRRRCLHGDYIRVPIKIVDGDWPNIA